MEEIYVNKEIREILIELAVQKKTITYSRLNSDTYAGYNLQDPEDRDVFNEDLEAISLSEVKNGRPPLSCLVVYKSGSSSKPILESFYNMCEELYEFTPETTKPNAKLLRDLQARCNEYWSQRDNYKKFGPIKY
ncbi:MAG: hypothetical protein ACI9N1_002827 [Flavobacteriales bacterium]|jgi:hypothetical protein